MSNNRNMHSNKLNCEPNKNTSSRMALTAFQVKHQIVVTLNRFRAHSKTFSLFSLFLHSNRKHSSTKMGTFFSSFSAKFSLANISARRHPKVVPWININHEINYSIIYFLLLLVCVCVSFAPTILIVFWISSFFLQASTTSTKVQLYSHEIASYSWSKFALILCYALVQLRACIPIVPFFFHVTFLNLLVEETDVWLHLATNLYQINAERILCMLSKHSYYKRWTNFPLSD